VLLQNLGTGTKTWMRDCQPSGLGFRSLLGLARKAEVAGKPVAGNEAIDPPTRLLFSWNIGCFES
jgi:hypothetical protein